MGSLEQNDVRVHVGIIDIGIGIGVTAAVVGVWQRVSWKWRRVRRRWWRQKCPGILVPEPYKGNVKVDQNIGAE